ncbi:hypothetical protein A2761_03240 [Candidatus Kaiserbacteria bacterium RIFCSPHIGHO2_01_FULL_51_33]|nr:MAG: hypothetical protein A2761_03240 [Candidatus Kaiserbacteria bacterium RIFCSPHIGHO2_01_FULL_51_33]
MSLTSEDIQKLTSLLATKQDVQLLREDVSALRESVQGLTTAVDGLAGAIENLRLEYAAISTQLSRHEKWIKQIAEKAGIKLEY